MENFGDWITPVLIVLFLAFLVWCVVHTTKLQIRNQKILQEGQRVVGVIVAGKRLMAPAPGTTRHERDSNQQNKVKFKMFYTSPFTGETVEMNELRKEYNDLMPQELRYQMLEQGHLEDLGKDILGAFQGKPSTQPYPDGRFGYTWGEEKWKILNVPIKLHVAVAEVKGKEVAVVDWEKTFSDENIADIGGLPRA